MSVAILLLRTAFYAGLGLMAAASVWLCIRGNVACVLPFVIVFCFAREDPAKMFGLTP